MSASETQTTISTPCSHEATDLDVISNVDGYSKIEIEGVCRECGQTLYGIVDAATLEVLVA